MNYLPRFVSADSADHQIRQFYKTNPNAAAWAHLLGMCHRTFWLAKLNTSAALKPSGPTTSASRAERRLLSAVAAFQTAITVALLVGAGLLCRTVEKMSKVRLGYQTEHILALNVTSMELNN